MAKLPPGAPSWASHAHNHVWLRFPGRGWLKALLLGGGVAALWWLPPGLLGGVGILVLTVGPSLRLGAPTVALLPEAVVIRTLGRERRVPRRHVERILLTRDARSRWGLRIDTRSETHTIWNTGASLRDLAWCVGLLQRWWRPGDVAEASGGRIDDLDGVTFSSPASTRGWEVVLVLAAALLVLLGMALLPVGPLVARTVLSTLSVVGSLVYLRWRNAFTDIEVRRNAVHIRRGGLVPVHHTVRYEDLSGVRAEGGGLCFSFRDGREQSLRTRDAAEAAAVIEQQLRERPSEDAASAVARRSLANLMQRTSRPER